MKFTKMHGIGNDYIYMNCLEETVPDPSGLAVRLSDRHFGVGADGLILIAPSRAADFRMEMYNADGSAGKMCGNGIRCVAKYVYDKGLTEKTSLRVETGSGIRDLFIDAEGGKAVRITVDMGKPEFLAEKIPVRSDEKEVIGQPLFIEGKEYGITCVSMGNPHCVVFLEEDVERLDLPALGPCFERHEIFPDRVNTEFVNVLDKKTLRMRVWERGSGETLACGTGACASVAAAVANGLAEAEATVRLLGGDLLIRQDPATGSIYMTGTATTVFEGEL